MNIVQNATKKLEHKKMRKFNQQVLQPKRGKDYAEVLFLGDIHYGHPNCKLQSVKEQIDYCVKNNIYVMLMGDLLECGTKGSVSDGVYNQLQNPQEQIDDMIKLLMPLARKGLILGIHKGNHEERIQVDSGIEILKNMSRILDVPYLGYSCSQLWKVGNQNYKVYTTHGKSSSTKPHTKMANAISRSLYLEFDLFAMGHVHELLAHNYQVRTIDTRNKQTVERRKWILLTGHYLGYEGGYAEDLGLAPSKIGSPKVKFFTNKKDIHISL